MAARDITWVPVIIAGLVTSSITLAFAWLLGGEFNLMGLYVWFVIPAGALIAGLCAGSGYGIASWLLGTKITGRLLGLVLLLQVSVYFGAQYLEYQAILLTLGDEGVGYGFLAYFDEVTASFSFDGENGLGLFGYLFRGLELLGFAAGGAIAPAVLRSKPYCEGCSRYMRTKPLGVIRAGNEAEDWKKGTDQLKELQSLAAADDRAAFLSLLSDLAARREEAARVADRLVVSLQGCPRCGAGFVCAHAHRDVGEQVEVTELDKTTAAPGIVLGVLGRS